MREVMDNEAQQLSVERRLYQAVVSGPGPASTDYSYYLPQEPGSYSQSQPQHESYRSNVTSWLGGGMG